MNIRLAEWILSTVLPPDRAAATVGDLVEGAAQRGNLWFWSCVLRTAAAQVWHDLTQRPLLMARLGIWGFAKNMLVPVGMFAVLLLVLLLSENQQDARYRHDWIFTWIIRFTQTDPSRPGNFDFTWPIQIAAQFLWAKFAFRTSQWLGRRAPGREIAACVAIALTGWIVIFAEASWARYGTGLFKPNPIPFVIPIGIAHDLILFAGAIWTTRQKRSHLTRI